MRTGPRSYVAALPAGAAPWAKTCGAAATTVAAAPVASMLRRIGSIMMGCLPDFLRAYEGLRSTATPTPDPSPQGGGERGRRARLTPCPGFTTKGLWHGRARWNIP